MFGSILLFLVLAVGFGFIIDIIIKSWRVKFIEKIVIRLGAGLLLFPVVGLLFETLRIPLFWPYFLLVAFLFTGIAFYLRKEILIKDFKDWVNTIRSLKISKSHLYGFLVLFLFLLSAYMYISGSFAYPWLENGDPYGYAADSKYIAMEKTYSSSFHFQHYAYPYTQGYQVVMGVIHQTNDSLYWNMKFFNALIIAFSVLFFYYFARRWGKNNAVAFWATFTLVAIPAWLSHFVFSLNFNMSLLLVFFYSLICIRNSKRWGLVAGLLYGGLIISHFYTSVVITLLAVVFWLLYVLVYKRLGKPFLITLLVGSLIGLLYWIPAIFLQKELFLNNVALGGVEEFYPLIVWFGNSLFAKVIFSLFVIFMIVAYWRREKWFPYLKNFLQKKGIPQILYFLTFALVFIILIIPRKIMYVGGSASREYTLKDFFIAQQGNMINNPLGIGIFLMIIFTLGMLFLIVKYKKLFSENNFYLLLSFTWAIVTLLGVLGASFSIGFVPFRMWTFFAIPVALITGYTLVRLFSLIPQFCKSKKVSIIIKILALILVVVLVHQTSFSQKYWHNTAPWPEHHLLVPDSQELYVWMRDSNQIPKDAPVYSLCHKPTTLYGYDLNPKMWQNPQLSEESPEAYYKIALNQTIQQNYHFLQQNGMDFVVLGVSCVAKHAADPLILQKRVNEMVESENFELVYSTTSEILFKIK